MPKKSLKPNNDTGDLFGFRGPANVAQQAKKHPPEGPLQLEQSSMPQMATRFFSMDEVAQRYGISHASVWRWVKNADCFPAPIKLSPGTSRWSEEQLAEFEYRAALNQTNSKTGRAQKARKNPTTGRTP